MSNPLPLLDLDLVVKADLDPVLDAQRKEEAALIGRWSSTTQPEKTHVWKIEQYMDYLDDDSAQPPAAPHPSPPKHAQERSDKSII